MTKTTTVLYLDNSFTFGGAINSLVHFLKVLDRDRYTPVLVTGQPRDFLNERFPDTTCYHYVPKLPWVNDRRYRAIASLPPFRIRLLLKALNLSRFIYWTLFVTLPEAWLYYRLGKKHRVGLIHLNNILNSQLAGIIASKWLGVPCVANLMDFAEVDSVTRLYARLIDHHVAISNAMKDNLLQLGVPEARISVVHLALDLEEFSADVHCDYLSREFALDDGALKYGIFGRVIHWKGIREFLEAARLIATRLPQARGFIVGGHSDGDEAFYNSMLQLSQELGLSDKVIFTGYRRDVPALMKFMDVVVHASNTPEPFGMVVIEGMAMGKPVVATRAGGPLDIIDQGETGYLVEVGNAKALAEAVAVLLQQPALREKMGRLARLRVEERYSNEQFASKMIAIYQRVAREEH